MRGRISEEERAYQRAYWSRPEMRHYQRDRRRERRAEFFADKRCVDCGGREELELDHIDRANKIDSDVWLWSRERREAEVAKCEVRCSECHKVRHGKGRRTHGIWLYSEHRCRCEVCLAAKSEYNRRRRERRRRESNARDRICNPTPEPLGHVASQPTLFDLEKAACSSA